MPSRETVAGAAGGSADASAPIAAFGWLSDCERSTLVAAGGTIEWLCSPRFDSPSRFGRLLDPDAGH